MTTGKNIASEPGGRRLWWRMALKTREATLLFVIVLVFLALSVLRPQAFLDIANFEAIANGMLYDVLMAAGLTLVLIVGGIDLSVGAVLAFSAVVTTESIKAGNPVWIAIPFCLVIGCVMGSVNGFLIARFRIAPFISTLATMSVTRGLALVISMGYFVSGLPQAYVGISRAKVFGVPFPVAVTVALLLALELLLRFWRPFNQAYYVGKNYEAARLSGIPVRKITFAMFLLSGFFASLAALFMSSRLGMGWSGFGVGAELRAIAAAVIGGASMSGGSGSILGAFLGVVLLAFINNGFVLLNGSANWQQAVSGIILIVAVGVDAYRLRKERKE